jgi:hypothetical protein
MGKIEKIFDALRLFDRRYSYYTLYYDVEHDRFDVIDNDFFLHGGDNNELHLWFIMRIPKKPVAEGPEKYHQADEFFIPAKDVFRLLGIDDSSIPGWRPEYLHEIFTLLGHNAEAFEKTFSLESQKETAMALMPTDRNESEKVKQMRNRIQGHA